MSVSSLSLSSTTTVDDGSHALATSFNYTSLQTKTFSSAPTLKAKHKIMMRWKKGWNPVSTKSESPITLSSSSSGGTAKPAKSSLGTAASTSTASSNRCCSTGCIWKTSLCVALAIGLIVGLTIYFGQYSNVKFSLPTTLLNPPSPGPASPGYTNTSFTATLNNSTEPNNTTLNIEDSGQNIIDVTSTKDRRVKILDDLNYISPSDSLLTSGTPQNLAADWIINSDTLRLSPETDMNLRQRYILAVLYFSLVGATDDNNSTGDPGLDTWLSGLSECDWDYVECNNSTVAAASENQLNSSSSLDSAVVSNVLNILNESSLEISNGDDATKLDTDPQQQKKQWRQVTSLEMNRLNIDTEANATKTLPDELNALLQLKTLRLSSNQLKGPIPLTFERLTEAQVLELTNNTMTGQIPDLSNLKNLEVLMLADNSFSGPIFNGIDKLTKLRVIDLANNDLSSTIPAEIGNLTMNLKELKLDYNNFTGTVPQSVCALNLTNDFGVNFSSSLPLVSCDCCSTKVRKKSRFRPKDFP